MTPEEFNARELKAGHIDARIVTLLTRDYQTGRNLKRDGKCGATTRADLLGQGNTTGEESPLGLMTLAVALEEQAKGAGEEGGNNQGPFVRKYTRGVTEGQSWCAWFMSWCIAQAALRLGYGMPIPPGRNDRNWRGARALARTALKVGGVKLLRPEVGALALWKRGHGWQRHIGIVEWTSASSLFRCVEGNKGRFPSKVRPYPHELGEPGLLYFVRLPTMGVLNVLSGRLG